MSLSFLLCYSKKQLIFSQIIMNNWQNAIGILAGLISTVGFIPYITAIYQKKTKPNQATWSIWTIVGFILLASYHSSGATSTIWVPACLAFGHLIIAILAFIYGERDWSDFDKACLIGTGVSLILWWWQNSPVIALSLNIAIDFLGALPTIKKAYCKPHTEKALSWILFLIAHILNLSTLGFSWSFQIVAYPLYLFIVVGTIVTLLLRSQIKYLVLQRRNKRVKTIKRRRAL